MFLIVFRRNVAVVFVGEREIEEDLAGDLGLQHRVAADDVIAPIEYRWLVKRHMAQRKVVGELLDDLGTDGNAVVVVGQMGLVGEVIPIVNESATNGIVAKRRYGVDAELHADEPAQLQVITLESVGEHLTGQKRRVFVVLVQVGLHAAVDLEIGRLPIGMSKGSLVDQRAVKQLVVEVKGNEAVVAVDSSVVADVDVVDIACVERSTQTDIEMPTVLSFNV